MRGEGAGNMREVVNNIFLHGRAGMDIFWSHTFNQCNHLSLSETFSVISWIVQLF